MKAFSYVNPTNEKEAIRALSAEPEKVMPLGGGQDLLARLKDYVAQPDRIVNVKAALDATVTPMPGGGLKIGAAMKMVDLAEHAQVAKLYPAMALAAIEVGTPQIRNQGTVGGNLNQRPRCWYFRNEEFVCFKKGGNQCFSPAGENQFHAIFGSGPSFIVHPSSLAVPSVAYGATFRLAGPKGERMVAGRRLLHDADAAERAHRERARAERAADARHPAGARHGQERPLRGAVQGIARLADRLRHGRPRRWPATRSGRLASSWARSRRFPGDRRRPRPRWPASRSTRQTAAAAAEAALRDARPLSQNAYKVQVAKTAVKRAILNAGGITDRLSSE